MFSKVAALIAKKKKLTFAVIGILVLGVLVSFMLLSGFSKPPATTKPPVVGLNTFRVVSAQPIGTVASLNTLLPISVKFSDALGTNVSGMRITISPSIPFETYVLTTQPEVLWVVPAPSSTGQEYGWIDGVEYTVVIAKGSQNSSGALLDEEYTFSFTNATENITMYAQ
jgi:hypothetical protein